jgi:hypothetical protein
MTGVIEGHSLSHFVPGVIYEVDNVLGAQLVTLRSAVEVRATDPAIVVDDDHLERLGKGVTVIQPDKAADRPERRRRKRK